LGERFLLGLFSTSIAKGGYADDEKNEAEQSHDELHDNGVGASGGAAEELGNLGDGHKKN
jgi:hypothetical protein